jgi:hypothetical protein
MSSLISFPTISYWLKASLDCPRFAMHWWLCDFYQVPSIFGLLLPFLYNGDAVNSLLLKDAKKNKGIKVLISI